MVVFMLQLLASGQERQSATQRMSYERLGWLVHAAFCPAFRIFISVEPARKLNEFFLLLKQQLSVWKWELTVDCVFNGRHRVMYALS